MSTPDPIHLDDRRGPWTNRAMTCSACGQTWIATSPVDAVLPFECPACGEMKGLPERVRVAITIECPRGALKGHSIIGWLRKPRLQEFLGQPGVIIVATEKVAFPGQGERGASP